MESKSSIPRRVRPDDTTDTSSKKPDDQQTSLISTLAPPTVISEPPKKLKHTPPRNKSPVPTSSSTQSPSLRQPVNTMEHSTKTFIPPTKSANLSQGENRTISNLDKYIDVVASAIKKKKERSSANSVLDRINVGESRRESSKRGGGVDLVSYRTFLFLYISSYAYLVDLQISHFFCHQVWILPKYLRPP
jgi:hypothetical protein